MIRKEGESLDVALLREKIRIKNVDRKVYVEEMEMYLHNNLVKRRALRIGNDCLRYMTRRQNNMSFNINAKIFENKPRKQRMHMVSCNLTTSVKRNDGRLFRYGKRLMREDLKREVINQHKQDEIEELERVNVEHKGIIKDYAERCETYLHKQVQVEDQHSRHIAAKLVYRNLKRVLAELEQDLMQFPCKIKDVETKIVEKKKELQDFQDLKAGALRFLKIEGAQLAPLDEELAIINAHFEKIIALNKRELEERRKANSLAKFLADREAHVFNFTGSSNITEMKIQARNKALVNSEEMLIKLRDAMMVSDINNVVDCILDQEDVTKLLHREKEDREEENKILKADHERVSRNNQFLKFNNAKEARIRKSMESAMAKERQENRRFVDLDQCLRQQDVLLSELKVSLRAMMEQLRPIKIPDDRSDAQTEASLTTRMSGFRLTEDLQSPSSLVDDAKYFIAKLAKMKEIVAAHTVPIGRVKPLMLRLFKEKRLPPDSLRVELVQANQTGHIQIMDAMESDQPGYTSREMLKSRAEEIAAKSKKNKA